MTFSGLLNKLKSVKPLEGEFIMSPARVRTTSWWQRANNVPNTNHQCLDQHKCICYLSNTGAEKGRWLDCIGLNLKTFVLLLDPASHRVSGAPWCLSTLLLTFYCLLADFLLFSPQTSIPHLIRPGWEKWKSPSLINTILRKALNSDLSSFNHPGPPPGDITGPAGFILH